MDTFSTLMVSSQRKPDGIFTEWACPLAQRPRERMRPRCGCKFPLTCPTACVIVILSCDENQQEFGCINHSFERICSESLHCIGYTENRGPSNKSAFMSRVERVILLF